MKKIFTLLLLVSTSYCFAQKLDKLTVEKIMRDPKWIGTSPTAVSWSEDSKKINFTWNPENKGRDAQYSVTPEDLKPKLVTPEERRAIPTPVVGNWNRKHTMRLIEKNGDIYILDDKTRKETQLTSTLERESNASFSADDSKVFYLKGDNYYSVTLNGGLTVQLTNFVHPTAGATTAAPALAAGGRGAGAGGRGGQGGQGGGAARGGAGGRGGAAQAGGNEQEVWLHDQQMGLFDVLKDRASADRQPVAGGAGRGGRGGFGGGAAAGQAKHMTELSTGDRALGSIVVSPDGRFVTYRLTKAAEAGKIAVVPSFVTTSGFTEDIPNRTKVGAPQSSSESFVYDAQRDTLYNIKLSDIPGIKDIPKFFADYPQELAKRQKANEDRKVTIDAVSWSEDGKNAVVTISAQDYKDRWIMRLNPETGGLTLLDRMHDDAWVGGTGGRGGRGGEGPWLDNTHYYYQSETSGYSHIYVVDVVTGEKKQLTSGKWEVSALKLSNDKKTFYFKANMERPGNYDYYRMPVTGGAPVKLTSMKGTNDVELSPDEKWLAITYSNFTTPFDLYIQPNKPGAKAVQVTSTATEEYKSYPWRSPEMFVMKNRDGVDIYAQVYTPKNPLPSHPAVIFVHGAGYLQDIVDEWSHYFREHMFNNLLADEGYTVMEVDYTGSAGYGRDIRTGIYRHMGGKDLNDNVDAAKYLVEKYGVNPKNIGLYGGSYGGFMTLMAMFTAPDVFSSGAALRSVTNWANYNHGYTANILNNPYDDPNAYKISSPIYFAPGLKGNLLMLHGMVDQNVNFQDIVELTQRLIELHKDNWSLAPYPMEDHDFIEPSSWTDEYSRIHKLFQNTLKN